MSDISKVSMIVTQSGITLFLDGRQYTVPRESANFKLIQTAMKEKSMAKLRAALDIKEHIATHTEGRVTIVEGAVCYDGVPLRNALATRVASIMRDGFDFKPLMRFIDKVMLNPLESAREELYLFLEASLQPITPDGDFLAYKRVRNDYLDIYSGSISNEVGAKPQMDRGAVDTDRTQTCSRGLHVCSESYLPHFGAISGNRVVICKVNPADVMAVPIDYRNAKMRVSQYEVVGEVPQDEAGELLSRLDDNYSNQYDNDSDDYDEDDDQNDWYVDADDDDADEEPTIENVIAAVPTPTPVNPSAKMNPERVRALRSDLSDGHPLALVAKWYDISPRQAGRIRDGLAWGDVV